MMLVMTKSIIFLPIFILAVYCSEKQKLRMKLFTPTPAVTSITVKKSMQDDVGLGEIYYKDVTKFVRENIIRIAGLDPEIFSAVLMQGSGTYADEAAIRTATPKNGKVLILSNGYFAEELQKICKYSDIEYDVLSWEEGDKMNLSEIENYLKNTDAFSTVVMVHIESINTMLNPVKEVGKLVKKYWPHAAFVVDAIGSFLCFPFDFDEAKVDFLTSKPSRCLDSFPGFELVVARKKRLIASKDNCRSYVLNVYDQWHFLENSNSFRFTTPTVLTLALKQGIVEYFEEGQKNRFQRYSTNRDIIRKGMSDMGFVPFVPAEYGKPIATAFYSPNHVFNFSYFQNQLERRGTYTYSYSLSKFDLFRVGHIGHIDAEDSEEFLETVKSVLNVMNITVPFPPGPYKTKSP